VDTKTRKVTATSTRGTTSRILAGSARKTGSRKKTIVGRRSGMTDESHIDRNTAAYLRRCMRGLMHTQTLLSEEIDQFKDRCHNLKARLDDVDESVEGLRADIGKLQETIELARKAFQDLKGQKDGR